MNSNDFFDATPELQIIRQWSNARYAAVWAVFLGILLRVSASTGPEVQVPGFIGGRASLNLLGVFVAPSGGGKGISDKVARLAWPTPIVERPIGSGEGIAATFVPPKKEGVEPITRAIINVPEIDTLAGIASRQGSILLAQLKSAAMGEQLGQANSSETTTRIVAPHSYRMCMSIAAQPLHTGVLLNDTTGGTPQRLLWILTTDPDMPADDIADPEPLNTRLPFWKPGQDGVVEIVYAPDHIKQTVIEAHIARQRGQADALDGHAMLTRLKVAACLAILHHRMVVSELDWELSGVVMEKSNQTREWVLGESKKADRAKVRDRAISRAVGEEAVDLRRLTTVRKRILSVLSDGELAGGKLRAALGRREYRELFDQAVMSLENEGQIVTDSSGPGTRYALNGGLNTEHPVQPSYPLVGGGEHPLNTEQSSNTVHSQDPQVKDDVPQVQGVPSTTLHAVADPPGEVSTKTARQWIEDYVSDLLTAGQGTVESGIVYTAGVAAGYKIDNLRQAVKKSDLISVAARKGSVTVWNLGTGGQNTIVSCETWLTDWLRDGKGWVKAADVYAAGADAGYGRDTVKSASIRAEISKRGQSVSTEWSVAS